MKYITLLVISLIIFSFSNVFGFSAVPTECPSGKTYNIDFTGDYNDPNNPFCIPLLQGYYKILINELHNLLQNDLFILIIIVLVTIAGVVVRAVGISIFTRSMNKK